MAENLSAEIMKEVKRYDDGNGCTWQQLVDNIMVAISHSRAAVAAEKADAGDAHRAAFTAYNQAIEDALAAIREESQGGGYWAATYINAIARKCSPHVYINSLPPAAPSLPEENRPWYEAASIVQACLNVHSTYSDAEREFAAHLIEVFNTRDQHPDYKHRNTVRAYPAATPSTATHAPCEVPDCLICAAYGPPVTTITSGAREAAEEIDSLLVPLREYAKTPGIDVMEAIISKHFPSAVPIEEQNHEFAFDQRCYYCRNKCCHGADAHAAAISEHG